jgi:hypothetical protein
VLWQSLTNWPTPVEKWRAGLALRMCAARRRPRVLKPDRLTRRNFEAAEARRIQMDELILYRDEFYEIRTTTDRSRRGADERGICKCAR